MAVTMTRIRGTSHWVSGYSGSCMQVRFSGLFARVAGRQRNMLAGIDDSADARVSRLRAVTSVGCRRPVLGKPEELVCDREACGLTALGARLA